MNYITNCIIMLLLIQENGKVKCHRYYPSDEEKSSFVQFEQVRVGITLIPSNNLFSCSIEFRRLLSKHPKLPSTED